MTTYSFEPTTAPEWSEGVVRSHERPGAPGILDDECQAPPSAPAPGAVPPGAERAYQPFEPPELPVAGESDPTVPVRSAEPSLEDLIAAARQEGRVAGIEEGRREEAGRLTATVDAVKRILSGIEAAAASREQEARTRVAVLATGIAAHLIEREVRVSPELVSDLVRRAIAEFPVRDALRVHMNPSDLALLSSELVGSPGRYQLTSGQTVRWVPDPDIHPGGCLVEGPDRIVDARLSTTLERICRALTDG